MQSFFSNFSKKEDKKDDKKHHLVFVRCTQELSGSKIKDRHIIKPLKEAIDKIEKKFESRNEKVMQV
jgi:hypothetical protein